MISQLQEGFCFLVSPEISGKENYFPFFVVVLLFCFLTPKKTLQRAAASFQTFTMLLCNNISGVL